MCARVCVNSKLISVSIRTARDHISEEMPPSVGEQVCKQCYLAVRRVHIKPGVWPGTHELKIILLSNWMSLYYFVRIFDFNYHLKMKM